ncbi:hypothetical protein N7539_008098, partial [Penicillium diatomitis]
VESSGFHLQTLAARGLFTNSTHNRQFPRSSVRTRIKVNSQLVARSLSSDLRPAEDIVSRLDQDQKLCRDEKPPNSLVLKLSKEPPELSAAISWHLTPRNGLSEKKFTRPKLSLRV